MTRQQMTDVASTGFRSIAPDMRRYGRSSAPSDSTLRNWGLAPDAANPPFAWFREDLKA